jgi:hypothetical protein
MSGPRHQADPNRKNLPAEQCFCGNYNERVVRNLRRQTLLFKNMGGLSKLLVKVILLAGCLLMLSACPPRPIPPPPGFPSEVFTQTGMAFPVRGLRMPGTFQDWRLRQGDSIIWLPFDQVEAMRFTGPVQGGYRPAQIFLSGGDQIKAEVFVDFLIEGTTDAGYWNMPMSQVERLSVGTE